MRNSIKNEIDSRVELLKEELNKQRDELYKKVDEICDEALKLVHKFILIIS